MVQCSDEYLHNKDIILIIFPRFPIMIELLVSSVSSEEGLTSVSEVNLAEVQAANKNWYHLSIRPY